LITRRNATLRLAAGLAVPMALAGGAAGGLTACSFSDMQDHNGVDAPSAKGLANKPRVAWVFSSGGPRGFVHVGVLKALASLKLRPDVVVGSSVGALVGSLYAAGMPVDVMENLALDLNPLSIMRMAARGDERFSGTGIADFVREQALLSMGLKASVPNAILLERLHIPSVCVAQRVADKQAVAFTHGDMGVAVQASSAVEQRFVPVTIRGQRYCDADLLVPMPVRIARAHGASRVLAVDASAHENRAPSGAERYRVTDARKRALTQPDAESADLLLHPEFGYWVRMDRAYREEAIDAGFRTTMSRAADLFDLHA
jgi:NTE family protein